MSCLLCVSFLDRSGVVASIQLDSVLCRFPKSKDFVGQGTHHYQYVRWFGFRKQNVAGVYPVVDADDADDIAPAEFQEYCQFTTATQGVGKFRNQQFFASLQWCHELSPQWSVAFVIITFRCTIRNQLSINSLI